MTLFKKFKVQPEGRNKYGNYYSKENVVANLTYAMYGGNTTTEEIPKNEENNKQNNPTTYILFFTSTQASFNGSDIATSAQTVSSRLVSYANSTPIVSYIHNMTNSADTFYGCTGYASSGMSINILNNGTSASTLQITATSGLNPGTGSIMVPCYVPKNGEVGMAQWADWKTLYDNGDLFYQELQIDWATTSDGTSVFYLDLTNETGSVNCDENGNVLPGAVLPDCWARFYYGREMLSGATYSIYIAPGYNANGVNFNTNTGYLYFGNDLSFYGKTLVVEITGVYNGITRTANFTLNKNIPGENGQDAEAKWLETNVTEIGFNPNTSAFTADHVSCKVFKQIGSGTPFEITSAETVWYRFSGEQNWTSGISVSVNIGLPLKEYVEFALATANFTIFEHETVLILSDGKKGDKGDKGDPGDSGSTGLQGAAIRGPVDWYSGITTNRRFCNGRGPLSGDTKFIDILMKDDIYYQCDISYDATPSDDWDNVKGNWVSADTAYNFVASEVLLANNAKIRFLGSNELFLMSGDTITGGAKGGSGDTIAFWAGGSNPNTAPYKVDHIGNLSATTGQFGFMKIGDITSMGNGVEGEYTYPEYSEWEGQTSKAAFSPQAIKFDLISGNTAKQTVVVGAITQLQDLVNAPITVETEKDGYSGYTTPSIYTNGEMESPLFTSKRNDVLGGQMCEMHPIMSLDLARIPVVFVTPAVIDSANTGNYFSKCYYGENKGYWVFRGHGGSRTSWTSGSTTFYYNISTYSGICTGVKYSDYPYPGIFDSRYVAGWGSAFNDFQGHWFFAKTVSQAYYPTSTADVKVMSAQITTAPKKEHIIYLELE